MTRMTDANNNATDYAYDSLIRFTSSTDALNGNTNLTYNLLDDVTDVKDQRNNTTTYTYNAFGDVISEASPDRGTIAYVVDKTGNVTQRTDARGVVTDYTWDALNRLSAIAYPSDSSLDATLTYDLTTGCGTAGIGRLCSVADASGTTTYEYNDLGHLTEVNEVRTSGPTLTTGYTYDLAGNVLTITLPSGRVITYTRNANGQASGVSGIVNAGSVQFASSVTYAPFGPVTGFTYGNSRTFSATFDQDYNPTNRTVSTIYNNAYDTDDNGNITQTGSTTYGYDAINRLNNENPGSATSYTYDATSNRLTKVAGSTTSTTVPATSNKISAVGGSSITYDSSGNYLTSGTQSYVWNAAGQLGESKVGGSTVGTYTYNASNQRTKKVAGGNTTQYVYGLNGLLYGEYTNAGALIREYVYLNDAPLAQIDAGTPEVLIYLHPDHLGTPRYATNTGGTQVWAANADAFGVGTPSGSATVNLRMPGQYYDSESGLFYNWNRYYSPAIGRYISSDPIGQEGGLNTFNYAESSPVMFIDPEGLVSACMPGEDCGQSILGPGPVGGGGMSVIGGVGMAGAGIGAGSILMNEDKKANAPAAPNPTAESCPEPKDLEGKTPEEVDEIMKGRGWKGEPSRSGGGTRYPSPNVKGEQVRVQPGYPGSDNPVKQGPYGVISKDGKETRVPLAGNPTLKK